MGRYLVALMDVVVDQLKQKPHDVSQDEGGDQVPVDDVSQTSYTPVSVSLASDTFHSETVNLSRYVQARFFALTGSDSNRLTENTTDKPKCQDFLVQEIHDNIPTQLYIFFLLHLN